MIVIIRIKKIKIYSNNTGFALPQGNQVLQSIPTIEAFPSRISQYCIFGVHLKAHFAIARNHFEFEAPDAAGDTILS
jgi:hypothetical protein